jgi:hypothetical protein
VNARNQRKSNNRNFISRFRVWASLLVFLNLPAGCAWWKPDVPTTPLSSESFVALKQKVALTRGLPFKRDVSYRDSQIFSATDSSPGKDFDDEYDSQSIARLSQVYKRMGLLPEATDLGKALADFYRLQRLTFYDGRGETIMVAPESLRLGKALAGDEVRSAESIPVVFALTQALQEQNFQWPSKLKLIPLEDRRLAFNAVARGDIVLIGLAHLSGNRPAKWPDQQQAIARLTNELERMASGLPPLLREKLVFPYREGSQFVQWAYAARGLEGLNALFANPPLSSAQIMHPEKFYMHQQNPLRIVAWGLVRQMKEAAVIDQTLGEYLTQILLASSHSHSEAARIASGWAGDHLSAYLEGENLITCWVSAWDNEPSAQKFSRAFETVLARRHGLRFETPAGQKNDLQAVGGGRSTLIQVRGSLVLFLDGLASTRVLESTERIWQELETGTDSTVIPFDSAKSRRQLASRRR